MDLVVRGMKFGGRVGGKEGGRGRSKGPKLKDEQREDVTCWLCANLAFNCNKPKVCRVIGREPGEGQRQRGEDCGSATRAA